MSATSDHPASGAVAAILAVTPMTSTGQVAHRYEVLPDLLLGVPCDAATFGDPTPVAVRQAAAVRPAIYREVADWIVAEHGQAGPVVKALAIALQLRANELETLAAEIEGADHG